MRGLRRVLPVSERYDGSRLLTRTAGRAAATPLLVALVAIAVTDVVFALDSIPAVFGVTRDLFVVFTSNAFAVLGLRALYFLLAGSADRFVYLKPGIALLLVFIGVKMLLYDVVHMPVWVSLVVIAAVGGGAVGASLWRDRRRRSGRAAAPARSGLWLLSGGGTTARRTGFAREGRLRDGPRETAFPLITRCEVRCVHDRA